jgi:HAD superfamily hydrolase (TIGR01509 family)
MVAKGRHLEALVFDMDGTLIDSSGAIPAAYIATIRDLGGPVLTPKEVITAYSVGPPRTMLGHLLGREPAASEVDRYHEILHERARAVTVYPGIEETLAALRQSVPLAVFTGASRRACEMLLTGTDLLHHFDVVVGGDEVERPKPEPDGIELACGRLGVPPGTAAYIGDAPNDLEAARRSGALAVAAAWGHQYVEGELTDAVIRDPEHLVQLLARRTS